jgi:hypothetical protein
LRPIHLELIDSLVVELDAEAQTSDGRVLDHLVGVDFKAPHLHVLHAVDAAAEEPPDLDDRSQLPLRSAPGWKDQAHLITQEYAKYLNARFKKCDF